MKQFIALFLVSICLFCLNGCKRDRIDHEDDQYIYVWKYDLRGDSTLQKFSQAIEYTGTIREKNYWRTHRYVGRPGHGGHTVTRRHYKVFYTANGNLKEWHGYELYHQVEKGDRIVIRESFYPSHHLEVIQIIRNHE